MLQRRRWKNRNNERFNNNFGYHNPLILVRELQTINDAKEEEILNVVNDGMFLSCHIRV